MIDRYFIMKLKSDSKKEIYRFPLDTEIETIKAKAKELTFTFAKDEKIKMTLIFNTNEKLLNILEYI